jgi:hypothetical protein
MSRGPVEVYTAYGELWKQVGDAAKARENYRIDIFRECGTDDWMKMFEEELARL